MSAFLQRGQICDQIVEHLVSPRGKGLRAPFAELVQRERASPAMVSQDLKRRGSVIVAGAPGNPHTMALHLAHGATVLQAAGELARLRRASITSTWPRGADRSVRLHAMQPGSIHEARLNETFRGVMLLTVAGLWLLGAVTFLAWVRGGDVEGHVPMTIAGFLTPVTALAAVAYHRLEVDVDEGVLRATSLLTKRTFLCSDVAQFNVGMFGLRGFAVLHTTAGTVRVSYAHLDGLSEVLEAVRHSGGPLRTSGI